MSYTYNDTTLTYDHDEVYYNGAFASVSFTVTVNGVVVSLLEQSLSIDDLVGERSAASFTIRDPDGTATYAKGYSVSIVDEYGETVFGGFLDTVEVIVPAPANSTSTYHSVTCVDNHYLADKRIVAATYQSQTAKAIVEALITDYLAAEGVTAGTIETGPSITAAIFDYIPVTEALTKLAEAADYWWVIDHDRLLHFRDRSSYTAPWNATAQDVLVGATLRKQAPQYRNRQYIRGGRNKTDSLVETRVGDDNTKSFTMGYPLAEEPTITVNAAAQTVGIKGVETGMDWYWSKEDPIITQDDAGTPLTGSQTLSVTYRGFYPVVVRSDDPEAIALLAAAEGVGTGYVENVDTVTQSDTQTEAFESANAKLVRFAQMGKVLRYRTTRAGLRPGQLQTTTLTALDLDAEEMLVQAISVTEEQNVLWYDVTAVSGPEAMTWTQFFRRLATGQSVVDLINTGSNATLAVLSTTSEGWTWGESVSQTAYACDFPAADLFPEDDRFPC